MDDEKRVSSEAPSEPAKHNAEAGSAASGAAPHGPEVDALIAENQALRAQAEEFNDRNLRLVAEMENLRRRTERDKSEFAKYAISEFARDILTVGDNLRRAIQSVPKEAVSSDPALVALIEGVEVTERDLLKVLERFQVKRFDPLGEPFNPHLHEAMTKVDVPNVPADTVVQTVHAGFMIGDRVLRPAAVIVAKGGTVEQPQRGGESETVPPGAMRVPDDVMSSPAQRQPGAGQAPGGSGGGPGSEGRGRQHRQGNEEQQGAWSDERVSQLRRNRQAGGGGGGGGGAGPFEGQRQNNQNRSSTLHKPVIGGGGPPKQEW